MKYSRFTVIVK